MIENIIANTSSNFGFKNSVNTKTKEKGFESTGFESILNSKNKVHKIKNNTNISKKDKLSKIQNSKQKQIKDKEDFSEENRDLNKNKLENNAKDLANRAVEENIDENVQDNEKNNTEEFLLNVSVNTAIFNMLNCEEKISDSLNKEQMNFNGSEHQASDIEDILNSTLTNKNNILNLENEELGTLNEFVDVYNLTNSDKNKKSELNIFNDDLIEQASVETKTTLETEIKTDEEISLSLSPISNDETIDLEMELDSKNAEKKPEEEKADLLKEVNIQIDKNINDLDYETNISKEVKINDIEGYSNNYNDKEFNIQEKFVNDLDRSNLNEKFSIINKENIFEQIVDKMKVNLNKTDEIKIKLKPDFLGEISFKITTEEGIVTAKAIVENYGIKQLLELNFDNLKQNMEEQGIDFATLDVSVGKDSEFNQNNSQSWNQETNYRINKLEPENINITSIYDIDSNSPIDNIYNNRGTIDLIV